MDSRRGNDKNGIVFGFARSLNFTACKTGMIAIGAE
jgi:hypothetical protein